MRQLYVKDIFCKILSNDKQREKMNSLNDQSKIYDLFCENGYVKSFDEFEKEMEHFLNSEDIKKITNNDFSELSDEALEMVAGGLNVKVTAKVSIATLMSAFTLASGTVSTSVLANPPKNGLVENDSERNKQQLSNGPLDFKVKNSDGTIGTAIKSGGKQNSILPLVYNDNYFSGSSTQYNKSLAAASLALELSGFADHSELGKEYTDQHKNAEDALKKLEFSDIKANEGYTRKPDKDSIGVMTACKETTVNGEDVAIIPVIIRGGGYELEWFSNTDVGATGDKSNHKGFQRAADLAKSHLKDYLAGIKKRLENKKIKLWIVGYSRGGATAGMLTKSIDDDIADNISIGGVALKRDDVYCYAFEPPKGLNNVKSERIFECESKDVSIIDNLYDNIYNVVNSKDIVTHVAPIQWDFVRPGQEYRLDAKKGQDLNNGIRDILNGFLINENINNAHVADFRQKNKEIFDNLSGDKGYSARVVKALNESLSRMIKLSGNTPEQVNHRDFYNDVVQKPVGKIISLYMGNEEFKDELAKEMSKPLIEHSAGMLDSAKELKDYWKGKDHAPYGQTTIVTPGRLWGENKETRYYYSLKEYIKFCGTASTKFDDGHTERKAARALCLTINRVIDRLIEKHKNEPETEEYRNNLEKCKLTEIKEYKKLNESSIEDQKKWFDGLHEVNEKSGEKEITKYSEGKFKDELDKDREIFNQVNSSKDRFYVKKSWFTGGQLSYTVKTSMIKPDTIVDEAIIADFIRSFFICMYENSVNIGEYADTDKYIAVSAAMHTPEIHLAQLINEDRNNTGVYKQLNNLIKSRYNKKWVDARMALQNLIQDNNYKYYLRKDREDTDWQEIKYDQLSDYHK